MSDCKIVLIGAGSYVFGHSALKQAYLDNRMKNIHMALVDVDRELVEVMGSVAYRFAETVGVKTKVTTHADYKQALGGADFVICSAEKEMAERFYMDCKIIDKYIPGHWSGEFGGVAGISHSRRQIVFTNELTDNMKRLCQPGAWLLTLANPLPRLCQTAHENGVPTVGFCMGSFSAFQALWRVFQGTPIGNPFTEAKQAWDITTAGVNHFIWLLEAKDRKTGEDVMPEFRKRIQKEDPACNNPLCKKMMQKTGYHLFPDDVHCGEFLTHESPAPAHRVHRHGSTEERKQRVELLRAIGEEQADFKEIIQRTSWERPMDLIMDMVFDKETSFNNLNLVNKGQIPNLPNGVYVETPVTGTSKGPIPQTVELPKSVLPLTMRTAKLSDKIVQAARERSLKILREVVELDPTIDDKKAGMEAVNACLKEHSDIIPKFF